MFYYNCNQISIYFFIITAQAQLDVLYLYCSTSHFAVAFLPGGAKLQELLQLRLFSRPEAARTRLHSFDTCHKCLLFRASAGNSTVVSIDRNPQGNRMIRNSTPLKYCSLLGAALFLAFLYGTACGSGPADYSAARRLMVERDLKGRDINDPAVLAAMNTVPRHLFVPERSRAWAYEDYPLPIGQGQTISQPYIVAFMTQALDLKKTDRVLEIGTGSGYQAAVLAEIVQEVYSIEIHSDLAARARKLLSSIGYGSVHVRAGDGFYGWPEHAPFDAMIVTCAAKKIPPKLVEQLCDGGRIIMPVGGRLQAQNLVVGVKKGGKLHTRRVLPVRFVPMTGTADDPA